MLYSLRNRLILSFVILLVLPLSIMVWLFTSDSRTIIQQSEKKSTMQTMDQLATYVNSVTSQIREVANGVLGNNLTQQWLAEKADQSYPESARFALNESYRSYLRSIPVNMSNVTSIGIFYRSQPGLWTSNYAYQKSDWYQAYERNHQIWVLSHKDPDQPTDSTREELINSFLFPLDELPYLHDVGVIKINFRTSLITDSLNKIKLGETGRVYLLNKNGKSVVGQDIKNHANIIQKGLQQLLSNPTQRKQFTQIEVNKTSYLLFYRTLDVGNWFLVGVAPEDELFSRIALTQKKIIFIGLLFFVMIITVAIWLSSSIAKPLNRLSHAMKFVEKAEFQAAEQVMPKGYSIRSEIGFVTRVFSTMTRRLRNLIETEFEMNLRRRDAEYKALLLQINPHFLYNTLEVIGSFAALKRTEAIIDVTESLGQMLRFSLRLNNNLVKLEEELTYIRHFITIMKLRYGERLIMEIENHAPSEEIVIVKFILQPLLENAVKFSLGHSEIAKVNTTIQVEENHLIIAVSDNGSGMDSDLVEQLVLPGGGTSIQGILEGTHIGLRNVIARCSLYYGEQFKIDIQSDRENGTCILLQLPLQKR